MRECLDARAVWFDTYLERRSVLELKKLVANRETRKVDGLFSFHFYVALRHVHPSYHKSFRLLSFGLFPETHTAKV